VVNELLGVLLIADTTNKLIVAYEYDETIIKALNQTAPFKQTLVSNVT